MIGFAVFYFVRRRRRVNNFRFHCQFREPLVLRLRALVVQAVADQVHVHQSREGEGNRAQDHVLDHVPKTPVQRHQSKDDI